VTSQKAFNPYLKAWQRHALTSKPGAGVIEQARGWENIVWQTRAREPNEYEQRMVQALERVFGQGAQELHDVVSQLNALGVYEESGHAWTEESFRTAMAALGH
jgi:hypothetical protein